MHDSTPDNAFVFIVGSPRSGTTLLGEILDKHKHISQWYEPYFVWDRHFRRSTHDERIAQEATLKIRKQISIDFLRYRQKTKCRIVVDKSPRNSLKIPFIRKIFPKARFIHIVRDGRDVTLSIHKEWLRRKNIVADSHADNRFNYTAAISVVKEWLGRQPFLEDKIRALWFETHGHFLNKSLHLNRLRWKGGVGWGPRFKGWETLFEQLSLLQFNAHQWLKCVEHIQKSWPDIPVEQKIEIGYEGLLQNGGKTIGKILDFLNLEHDKKFFLSIPELKKNNFNKWQKEFSREQINEMHTILTPMLIELGYEDNYEWPSKTM